MIGKFGKPRAKAILPLGIVAFALIVAGCDVHENADLANGQQLFGERCGSCHTLARAGTQGTIGPDLDAAFRQARADGMDQDTVEGVVEAQIETPRLTQKGAPDYMPANLVEGDGARDVAAFVAHWAGLPGVKPAPLIK